MSAEGFTLRECWALGELGARWPGTEVRLPDTPPVFRRLGLELALHAGGSTTTDLTGELVLDHAAAAWLRTTSAASAGDLVEALETTPLRVLALYAELESTPSSPLAASVFATLDWTRSPAEQVRDACTIAGLLLPPAEYDAIASALDARLTSLGARARAYHLGVMLGRARPEVRVVAIGTPEALAGAAVPATDVEALTDWMRELGAGDCAVSLHLTLHPLGSADVAIELAPRIELEAAARDAAWPVLFDRLRGRGLVDPARVERLLAWRGAHVVAGPRAIDIACERALSHVKLVRDAAGHVRSKGYATLTPRPRASPRG